MSIRRLYSQGYSENMMAYFVILVFKKIFNLNIFTSLISCSSGTCSLPYCVSGRDWWCNFLRGSRAKFDYFIEPNKDEMTSPV